MPPSEPDDRLQPPPDDSRPPRWSSPAPGRERAGAAAAGGSRYCLRCSHRLGALPTDTFQRPICPECRLPYNPANPETYATAPRQRWLFWLALAILLFINGCLTYIVILWMEQTDPASQLGSALFLAVPFSLGALLGYLTRPGVWGGVLLSIFAVLVLASVMFLIGLHGAFCFLTLGAFAVIPAVVGAVFGWALRRIFYRSAWDGRRYFFLLGLAALPFGVDQVERKLFPMDTDIAEVRTEAVFPAPPARVWDRIVFYEQVEREPSSWLLRFALPRPVRAEGSKAAVGDVQRCIYRHGHLVKVITERVHPERLAFRVAEHHLLIERNVTLLDGAFLLEPCAGGQTRVILTTRYQRHLRPAWMWEWVERRVVHALHGHVLEDMRCGVGEPSPPPAYPPPAKPTVLLSQPAPGVSLEKGGCRPSVPVIAFAPEGSFLPEESCPIFDLIGKTRVPPMRCPLCRADNDRGPNCRRCRADISLLFALEEQRSELLALARRCLADGQLEQARDLAERAAGLRHGEEARRLVAACHLLRHDFAAAWRCYPFPNPDADTR